jgi:hypothetical protein
VSWVIAVPAWGERYRNLFLGPVLDAQIIALRELNKPFRYIVHTDDQEHIRLAFTLKFYGNQNFKGLKTLSVPAGKKKYEVFADAHRQALKFAQIGERVVLGNADQMISRELYLNCEKRLDEGKQLVMLSGLRVVDNPACHPPKGAKSEDLWKWTLEHLHPFNQHCIYGDGRAGIPSVLIFKRGANVVMRSFHMTPVVFEKQQEMEFEGTLDEGLPLFFKDMHIISDPTEGSMCDVTADNHPMMPVNAKPMNPHSIAAWAKDRANEAHRRMILTRCVIQGEDVDCGDDEVVREILRLL